MAAIKTTAPKTADEAQGIPAKECTLTVDFPEMPIQKLVEKFGEEAVRDGAIKSFAIDLQASVRRMLEQGSTVEEITNWVTNEWEPGTKAERVSKDPAAAVRRNMAALSPDERRAIFATLAQDGMLEAPGQ
jgi:hypothetical protein